MKIRLTLLAENDSPAEKIGATREEQNAAAKRGYDFILTLFSMMCGDSSKLTVESAEVLE